MWILVDAEGVLWVQKCKYWLRLFFFFSPQYTYSAPAPCVHKTAIIFTTLSMPLSPHYSSRLTSPFYKWSRCWLSQLSSSLTSPTLNSVYCLQYTFLNWLHSITYFDHLKHYWFLKTSSDLPCSGISASPLCSQIHSDCFFVLFCPDRTYGAAF